MQTIAHKRILQDYHKKDLQEAKELTWAYTALIVLLFVVTGIVVYFSTVAYQQRQQIQLVLDLKLMAMKNGYACSEEHIAGLKIEHCIRTVRKF